MAKKMDPQFRMIECDVSTQAPRLVCKFWSSFFEQWFWFGVLVVWGLWSLSHTWYLGFRLSVGLSGFFGLGCLADTVNFKIMTEGSHLSYVAHN